MDRRTHPFCGEAKLVTDAPLLMGQWPSLPRRGTRRPLEPQTVEVCSLRTFGAALSLNRSQCGGCSTENDTPAAI